MAPTGHPAVIPKLSSLGRLFRRNGAQQGVEGSEGAPAEDPLLVVGRRLREEREARGLNLRQLALETRISTPVLEALERGWRDRLPEGAYLRTMLPLIEQHLDLPAGSLDLVLPPERRQSATGLRNQGLLPRFTPGSIDVFSSWQGTVLYGAVTLGLIYGINLQQQQIAASNLLSLRPISPLPAAQQTKPVNAATTLLSLYPDLRPLQQASQGQAERALGRLKPASDSQAQRGLLELNLSAASAIDLQSESGQRSQLNGAKGQLMLQLSTPLKLTVSPAPKTGEVLWNGAPLASVNQQPGVYQLPQPRLVNADGAAAAPASPGTAP